MHAPFIPKERTRSAARSEARSTSRHGSAPGHARAGANRGSPAAAARLAAGNARSILHDFAGTPIHEQADGAASEASGPDLMPGPLQRKLAVGAVDDPLEHEADRVADRVMGMAAAPAQTLSVPAQVTRKWGWCADNRAIAGGAPESVRDTLGSPGQPLDRDSLAFFEPRFGHDFSGVRVHTDAPAAESARAVNARAYTVGQHMVFARDQYAPDTADGRHLLAHELAHTLQQRGGEAGLQRQPDAPGSRPPARPALADRLQIIEETGPAIGSRLNEIIRTGGPIPKTTKVIGAFIVDVEGYTGPREIRTINGANSDRSGEGAAVFHAPTPTVRTLTRTEGAPTPRGGRTPSILGPRNESINSHINDAEIKGFEFIISRLPPNARGTIHFTTMRVQTIDGHQVLEPYPACSGCIRASFETAGRLEGVDLVSHAAVNPPGSTELEGTTPPAKGGGTSAKSPALEHSEGGGPVPVKAQGAGKAPATTEVESPGANAGAKAPASKPAGPAPQRGRFAGIGVTAGATALTLGIGLLSSYLKARVDRRIAERQIDQNQARAQRVIDSEIDTILTMMLQHPDQTLYARVYMSSAVISTFEVNSSPEPTTSDSAPIIDLTGVGFTFQPLDPALADTFQGFSGGGRQMTMVRRLISEIPLETPPLESLIELAKARRLPLDDVRAFALQQFAGLDQTVAPKAFIASVQYWQHILALIDQAAPKP